MQSKNMVWFLLRKYIYNTVWMHAKCMHVNSDMQKTHISVDHYDHYQRPQVSGLAIVHAHSSCLSKYISKVQNVWGIMEDSQIVKVKLELKLGGQVWLFGQNKWCSNFDMMDNVEFLVYWLSQYMMKGMACPST